MTYMQMFKWIRLFVNRSCMMSVSICFVFGVNGYWMGAVFQWGI